MTQELQIEIAECYRQYCGVIKPLIAQIEAQTERFPLPLFNEIRAFNDHIARCYYDNPSDEKIKEQVNRAKRHITRITLDCFKSLNVIAYSQIEEFERQTRNIDLTVLDNGLFYPEYSRRKVEAARIVRNAKIQESFNTYYALTKYQEAFNIYSKIVESINEISEKVKWAKARFRIVRIVKIAGWILSVIISAVISAYFSCEIVAGMID